MLAQLMPQLTAPEKQLVEAFAGGSIMGVDALAGATGLGVAEVSSTLMMLELKKLVTKRADGTFEGRSRS